MTPIAYVLALMPVLVLGLVYLLFANLQPGILFGTSVPPEFPSSAAGRRILRDYRWRGITALAVFIIFGIIVIRRGRADFNLFALPAEIVIWYTLYFIAVRQTRPFAVQPPLVRSVSLTQDHSIKPMIAGLVAALVPLLAAAIYLHLHWAQIPESFPIHWGIQGRADGWSRRTVVGVYRPIWMGVAILSAFFAIGFSTYYAPGKESLRRHTRIILLMVSGLICLTFTWAALLPLIHSTAQMQPTMPTRVILFKLVSLCIILPLLFWGIRNELHQRKTGEPYDGTPDKCWYGGIFYFNPDDPSILVPKRFGFGYTFNFGHPISWLSLALLLVPLGYVLLHKHAF